MQRSCRGHAEVTQSSCRGHVEVLKRLSRGLVEVLLRFYRTCRCHVEVKQGSLYKEYQIGGQVAEAELEISVIMLNRSIKGIVEVTELRNNLK